MDLNIILAWLAALSSVLLIVGILRSPSKPWGWFAVGVGVLTIMGVMWVLAPAVAGWVGGVLWALFILAPSLLTGVVSRETMRQEFVRAAQWGKVIRLLHPFDGYWQMPCFYSALASERSGDLAAAERQFACCAGTDSTIAQMASVYLYRMRGEWEAFIEWVHADEHEAMVRRDLSLLIMYLRALGETGDLAGLKVTFERMRPLIMQSDQHTIQVCALMLFAFSGHRRGVDVVLDSALSAYPEPIRTFWRATADLVNGDETARERLACLLEQDHHALTVAVRRRLEVPLPDPQTVLAPEQITAIDALAEELEREEHYRTKPQAMRQAYVTYTLIGLNAVVFTAEMLLGGSTDIDTLIRVGAAVNLLVADGEWWRIITANFIHYGWLHLSMNMLALFMFGRVLESRLGHMRFLTIYLLAGIGAVTLALFPYARYQVLVGASGAIMGLIGAYAATSMLGWLREHARIARTQLNAALLIVFAQAAFDIFAPEVSGIAHFSGAVFGFGLTLLVLHMRRPATA